MLAKLTSTLAFVFMLGDLVTIDTQQISYVPSAPVRLGLVATAVVLCVVSLLLNRRDSETAKTADAR